MTDEHETTADLTTSSGITKVPVTRRLFILLVEDNPDDVAHAQIALRDDADLDVARSLKEALERLQGSLNQQHETYDAVLLDLGLPDNAIFPHPQAALEAVKVLRRHTRMPIIIYSGSTRGPHDELAQHAVQAGATFWLGKNTPPIEVVLTIRLELAKFYIGRIRSRRAGV